MAGLAQAGEIGEPVGLFVPVEPKQTKRDGMMHVKLAANLFLGHAAGLTPVLVTVPGGTTLLKPVPAVVRETTTLPLVVEFPALIAGRALPFYAALVGAEVMLELGGGTPEADAACVAGMPRCSSCMGVRLASWGVDLEPRRSALFAAEGVGKALPVFRAKHVRSTLAAFPADEISAATITTGRRAVQLVGVLRWGCEHAAA